MTHSQLAVRFVGACVLLAVAIHHDLLGYSVQVLHSLWLADAGLMAVLTALVQVIYWVTLLLGGGLLVAGIGSGKWLLLVSLVLSLAGGPFIAWLPGANIMGEFLDAPRLSLTLFMVLNLAMLVVVFRLDGGVESPREEENQDGRQQ